MAKPKRRNKDNEQPDGASGIEPKPADYQPTKAELEEDLRLPVSFDRAVKALFGSDKRQGEGHDKGC